MNQENTGGLRCHDAEACALGQKPCPTPSICGCAAPACAVKDGTHKPADAVHQIAEPDAGSMKVLIDFDQVGTAGPFAVVDGRVRLPVETMVDLARWLKPTSDAIAAAPQEPAQARTLLQEVLNEFCKDGHGGEFEDGEHPLVDRVRAFLAAPQALPQTVRGSKIDLRKMREAALHAQVQGYLFKADGSQVRQVIDLLFEKSRELDAIKAAAPQAVQDTVPLFWVRLLRDGLYEGPVHNNSVGGKMLRDEKPGEWHPLYLHTAPAHPAEGVPVQAGAYAEARECEHCNHVGINDSAEGVATCVACQWIGDSPKEDKCPDCEAEGTMTASCPKCHHEYRLIADATLSATHPTQQGLDAQTEAARSVLAERARQVAAEGWTPERDDEYTRGILGEAGGIYALHAFDPRRAKEVPEGWPWDDAWWKPKDPRTNLVKAGALILAEIERMDRSFAAQAKQGGV